MKGFFEKFIAAAAVAAVVGFLLLFLVFTAIVVYM